MCIGVCKPVSKERIGQNRTRQKQSVPKTEQGKTGKQIGTKIEQDKTGKQSVPKTEQGKTGKQIGIRTD